jgi:hypothetical protein
MKANQQCRRNRRENNGNQANVKKIMAIINEKQSENIMGNNGIEKWRK